LPYPRKYMPNIKSAAKAMRSSKRKQAINEKIRNKVKGQIKQIKKLIAEGKKSEAAAKMKEVMSALDKATKKHVLKKNTVSRRKSRLAKAINKLA